MLPKGTQVKILLTPRVIGKLKYDGDGDGTFESDVAPISPSAAKQIRTLNQKP